MDNHSQWTGERLETFVRNETMIEHLHRYALAMQLVRGKAVLDVASGEGYGSNLLASVAKKVIGVDISEDAVERAKLRYVRNNLEYKTGSASRIPLEDHSVDVVVSFETIEHHDQHDEMMQEVKRVLTRDGLLIISTPDKLYYSDKLNYRNPFHIKELYEQDFRTLINKFFQKTEFIYQKALWGSLFLPETHRAGVIEFGGHYGAISNSAELAAMYILAVASDHQLPDLGISLFNDPAMVTGAVGAASESLRRSNSYRLGHFLLSPLRIVKRLFNA